MTSPPWGGSSQGQEGVDIGGQATTTMMTEKGEKESAIYCKDYYFRGCLVPPHTLYFRSYLRISNLFSSFFGPLSAFQYLNSFFFSTQASQFLRRRVAASGNEMHSSPASSFRPTSACRRNALLSAHERRRNVRPSMVDDRIYADWSVSNRSQTIEIRNLR